MCFVLLKKRASQVWFIKKRASQGSLDPIQKRALSRSVQLEAVYLEALLYLLIFWSRIVIPYKLEL